MLTLKDLHTLSPKLQHWTDNLLQQHLKSAHPLSLPKFQSIPPYFNPLTLADARFLIINQLPLFPFESHGLPAPPTLNPNPTAITHRNLTFLLPSQAENPTTHFHELIHIVQHKILSPLLYPLIHLLESTTKPPEKNFLESTALELQSQFESQSLSAPVEPQVAAKIGFHLPQLLNTLLKGKI